jgi:trimeric autotransporter adhesin
VKVTGAYTNDCTAAESHSLVTVSRPITGGYIVGGGRVPNTNSSGYVKANAALPTCFEFDIVYTKSGSNPKGKATVMVMSYNKPDGTLDNKIHKYLISTSAIALLNVSATGTTAAPSATGTFSSKANLVELLPNGTTLALEGGATFQMVAYQSCTEQKLAITLYRKAGGVWFSNNWNSPTASTVLQGINGGKVYVDGGCLSAPRPTRTTVTNNQLDQQAVTSTFDLKASPNPTKSTFTLKVGSDLAAESINLRIYDLNGKVVHMQKGLVSGQTLNVGQEFTPGVYFAELTQGSRRKLVRLMKTGF